jgi:hypothetical protein
MFSAMLQKFSESVSLGTRNTIVLGVAIVLGSLSSLAMAQGTPVPGSVATGQVNIPWVAAGQTSSPRPPAGFDPLTASDNELKRYGFPPRPNAKRAPEAYKQWRKLVLVPRKGNPKLQPTNIYDGPAQPSQ